MAEPREPPYLFDERHLHEYDRALAAHGGHEATVKACEALGAQRLAQAAKHTAAVVAAEDLHLRLQDFTASAMLRPCMLRPCMLRPWP